MSSIEGKTYWQNRPVEDERKDWNDKSDWITGYWNSRNHPHRQMIVDTLNTLYPFKSVLEVGCNCGPNLSLIEEHFKESELTGVDVNLHAIEAAKILLPQAELFTGDVTNLPFGYTKNFDIVLADAVLMYIPPKDIINTMKRLVQLTTKALIIIDWYAPRSTLGTLKDHHWCRNYETLLKEFDFKVEKTKITNTQWPNPRWVKYGHLFVCRPV